MSDVQYADGSTVQYTFTSRLRHCLSIRIRSPLPHGLEEGPFQTLALFGQMSNITLVLLHLLPELPLLSQARGKVPTTGTEKA